MIQVPVWLGHGMQVMVQPGGQAAGAAGAADIKIESGFEGDTSQRADDFDKPDGQFHAQYVGTGN
jgi:hypothetical protein